MLAQDIIYCWDCFVESYVGVPLPYERETVHRAPIRDKPRRQKYDPAYRREMHPRLYSVKYTLKEGR